MRYLTNDLAKLLGVTTNTIRRYENSGFLTPERDVANYRYYKDFDISKTAIIRLYIKCGFSHSEIRQMIGNNNDKIFNICDNRLQEIDLQIERLKRLRHWLKDNMQLMITINGIRNNFVIMNCPALKYIIYSIGDNILNDKDRLNIINKFMYDVPEVQLITIFKSNDLKNGHFKAYRGWAVKEIDIEKFNIEKLVNNNFIETYTTQKCLYGVIEIPSEYIYDFDKTNDIRKEYLKRVREFIDERDFAITGDMIEFIVNALGDTVSILACIPISDKN
ncbi:MAG: MerR family transcriptional regulator [Clostridia bacterium]|nr:MerR family transcriptional regulator [Clostridia bacterium]